MASNIYRRGATYWWRRSVNLARLGAHPTIQIRISLRTSVLAEARSRGAWLEVQIAEINSAIQCLAEVPTPEDLRGIYQRAFKNALDRLLVEQMGKPWLEDLAIQRNGDRARFFTMVASGPTVPQPGHQLELELLQQNLEHQAIDRMQQVAAEMQHDARISTEALAGALIAAGVQANPTNIEYALRVVAVATRQACIEATAVLDAPDPTSELPPVPRSINAVLGLSDEGHAALPKCTPAILGDDVQAHSSASSRPPQPGSSTQGTAPTEFFVDCNLSQLAQAAVDASIAKGKWSETCRGDVRAVTNLFIAANGDLKLSEIRQHHVARLDNLLSDLPKTYGKLIKGGTKDSPRFETIEAALERGRALRERWEKDPAEAERAGVAKPGVAVQTRNKHLQWISQIFSFGNANGYVKVEIGVKALKLKLKDKKNSLRRSWDRYELAKLLSGPVWEGCAGIDHRLVPGSTIFHDGMYFAPLLIIAHGCRSEEAVGLSLRDVFDTAPIPFICYQANSYRRLKTDNSDRSLPIPKGLIELGFLDYCRALRAAGQELVFPELWNPRMELDKIFRDKVFYPLRNHHFPNGTSRLRARKDVDVHSLRTTATTLLDERGFKQADVQRFLGHSANNVTFDVYADDLHAAHFVPLVEAIWELIPPIRPAPINLRPSDRLQFGSKRGRRKNLTG